MDNVVTKLYILQVFNLYLRHINLTHISNQKQFKKTTNTTNCKYQPVPLLNITSVIEHHFNLHANYVICNAFEMYDFR